MRYSKHIKIHAVHERKTKKKKHAVERSKIYRSSPLNKVPSYRPQ